MPTTINQNEVRKLYEILHKRLSDEEIAFCSNQVSSWFSDRAVVTTMKRLEEVATRKAAMQEVLGLFTTARIHRDSVIDAIDELLERGHPSGLCDAFRNSWCADPTLILDGLGGNELHHSGYYFERDQDGFNERLLFLSFMLTWLDDAGED